ncbi:MAG: ATP-dependent zinc metalloprotease FtsH [Candidatus Shapirobacteria bacterium]
MAKKDNISEKFRKIVGLSKKDKTAKPEKVNGKAGGKNLEELGIPKEVLDRLPPGVKIRKIEIGPSQIMKWLIYMILIFWFFSTIRSLFVPEEIVKATLSEVVGVVKGKRAEKVTVVDNEVIVKVSNENKILVASKEANTSMVEILQREGVDMGTIGFTVENRQGLKILGDVVGLLLSIGLPILFIVWFFSRQSSGSGGGIFGFGKSTARLFVKGKQNVTFKDVAGVEEAKKDLEEVVDFLKNPDKYKKMGARAPKGVLLVGPSGVGKTLLAKAVAGEANVPFYSMAGSEFMEMLVGVGASRVRDLFGTAKKAGKAIIFIDEIDAIGRARGGSYDGGHGEREQTLNQILVEMDGFEPNTAVVVLAATNRGDLLDPALLRPGRFDRRVVLEMPDLEARKEILKIHAKGKPFEEKASPTASQSGGQVDWERVARRTVGFSGADIENMLNEAAIKAARENKQVIGEEDVEEAALRVKLGSEKRRTQTEEDKLMTAYHEGGHAVVNYVEGLDPVHRISIVSRGVALGYTLVPPKKDRMHETKTRLIKQMAMAMGGRAAEEMKFNDMTTGASSDIAHATDIARAMVIEWGMSKLGPVNLGPQVNSPEFGRSFWEPTKISDGMMVKVDEQINGLVMVAYERAKKILDEKRVKLDEVAKVLVEKESLTEEEFEELMK